MRVDSQRIRAERMQRAWSQEHLAHATGLGLRTVQRIEASGLASNESIAAVASAFGVLVSELIEREVAVPAAKGVFSTLTARRFWILLAVAVVVQELETPPPVTAALVALWFWVGTELVTAFVASRFNEARG